MVSNFDPNYLRTGKTEWAVIIFRTDLDSVFRLKSNFNKNCYQTHHLQGGMKFATQISTLLNCQLYKPWFEYPTFYHWIAVDFLNTKLLNF